MAEILQFEQNGVKRVFVDPPDPVGMPGGHVVALVGTAPDKAVVVSENVPIRVYDHEGLQILDTVGNEAGTLFLHTKFLLEHTQVPVYLIVVPEGATEADTINNVIGGVNPTSGLLEGISAIEGCVEVPTLIGAPSFSHVKAVADALATVGAGLLAQTVIDTPSTTDQDAIDYSALFGSAVADYEAVSMAGPDLAYYSRAQKTQVYLAGSIGLIAAMASREVWEGGGGVGLKIEGTMRPLVYQPTNAASRHNLLNRHGICVIAQDQTSGSGFRVVGNRTVTGRFAAHIGLRNAIGRRLAAVIAKTNGRNLTESFFRQQIRRIREWGERMVLAEALPSMKIYLHPTLNTASSYANGTWYVVVAYGEYSPNELCVLRIQRDQDQTRAYVEGVINV